MNSFTVTMLSDFLIEIARKGYEALSKDNPLGQAIDRTEKYFHGEEGIDFVIYITIKNWLVDERTQ